jgi:N-acetylmuramoyl-L-alanine amidase
MKVALVIGHKKNRPGACNEDYGKCEFEFNEKLVKDIKNKINRNYEVEIVYRDTYRDLPDKVNKLNPDFVVSFHCNAFNKKASGSEVLYYRTSKKGKEIARIFQKYIIQTLGLYDRGIKGKGSEDRGGYILRYTKAPCILIEPFFIDNNVDYMRVQERYDAFVEALKNAIYDTLGVV